MPGEHNPNTKTINKVFKLIMEKANNNIDDKLINFKTRLELKIPKTVLKVILINASKFEKISLKKNAKNSKKK
tara:strand:- start:304 stop:522 length:219 start_codon:yes stop_codon:yes gene_type:complete